MKIAIFLSILFLYENSHFIFKILSKYTPKLIKRNMFSIFFPLVIPNIASVYLKYLFFYIKSDICSKIFKDKIGSKYTPKRTKLHHFKKISRGGGACPQIPLEKRMASQISKSEKKFLAPLPKSWLRPWKVDIFYSELFQIIKQNASIVEWFQKFHREISTHIYIASMQQLFLINIKKYVIFRENFKTQFNQKIHQNAPNCTIF